METTKRKRTVAGPSLAEARSSEKKAARNTKRTENLAAEQMRPAGEKIQPHERSKQDFKNNST